MADEPLAVPESSGLANNEVDDRQSYFTQGASGQDFTGADEYPPPPVVTDPEDFIYNADQPPDLKFRALGWRLSQFGDLFRHPDHGSGLLLVVRGGKPRAVGAGDDEQRASGRRQRPPQDYGRRRWKAQGRAHPAGGTRVDAQE